MASNGWMLIQVCGLGAIMLSTVEHVSRGKALLNIFRLRTVNRAECSAGELWLCILSVGVVAWLVANIIYEPQNLRHAMLVGFLIAPFVHDNRLTQFVGKQTEK